MKTLYVSDLDGTLLNDEGRLSENTITILNDVIDKGIDFTFATARSISSASVVSEGLHLKTGLIVYNGVYIVDSIDYHILYQHSFTTKEAKEILDKITRAGQHPFVYAYIDGVERVSYREAYVHEGGLHYLESRKDDPRLRPVENVSELYEGDIFYVTCIHDKEQLEPLHTIFEKTSFTLVFQKELQREEYWLEIMPSNVSKANAIQQLKEIGGYDRIISFGDAINDVPMFQMSDECYAVDNAIDEIKAIATDIIASNELDGVANWMRKFAK